jgi:hypothetical protein
MGTMAITLQVDPDRRLLHVLYSGSFTLAEAQTNFGEILAALVEHKLKKVLIDGRQIEGNPEPLERFYYGRYVADAVAQAINRSRIEVPRFAYVLEHPVLDPKRFGETVAINRGMRVKAFDNMSQAEWWLGVTAPE